MKRFILLLMMMVLSLSLLTACKSGADDGDENYVPPMGEFTLPTTDTAAENTVDYVVATLSEKFTIRDFYQMRYELIGAKDGAAIRVNGVTMEIYQFDKENEFFKEIATLGAYLIKNDEGKVLKTTEAYVNGSFVLVVSRNTNDANEDITEKNQKVVKVFQQMKLA